MTKIRSSDSSQIDDRRGRGGSRMGFPGGAGMPRIPMGGKAGGGILGLLVVLAVVFIPQLMGGGGGGGDALLTSDDQGGSTGATCDTEQEQIICGATVDVQQYWEGALPQAFGVDYQTTSTVFFSGSTNTGCGPASSEMGPFYCPLDSLVYFDLDFLTQLQQQYIGTVSDLAAQYIVAHEYGHHVQNILGTSDEVRRAQRQDPARANVYSVALELQADCYAGAWVRSVADRDLLDSTAEVSEALDAAAAVGDDRIQEQAQGRSDPETFTHGTAEQRQSWFQRGFDTGDPASCDTFSSLQ